MEDNTVRNATIDAPDEQIAHWLAHAARLDTMAENGFDFVSHASLIKDLYLQLIGLRRLVLKQARILGDWGRYAPAPPVIFAAPPAKAWVLFRQQGTPIYIDARSITGIHLWDNAVHIHFGGDSSDNSQMVDGTIGDALDKIERALHGKEGADAATR